MNWKRICRALLCLLVVCCIVFNLSPIRAQASVVDVAAVLYSITAPCFVGAAFQALGILPGSDVSVFNQLVDDCSDYLNEIGVGVDGAITMMAVSANATTGAPMRTYADRDSLQAVLDWLFVNAVVSSVAASSGKAYYNGVQLPDYTAVSAVSSYLDSMPSAYLMRLNSNGEYYLRIFNGAFFIPPMVKTTFLLHRVLYMFLVMVWLRIGVYILLALLLLRGFMKI